MKIFSLITLLLLSGCGMASEQKYALHARTNAKISELNRTCEINKVYYPYVAANLSSDRSKEKFVNTICAGEYDLTCQQRYVKMFYARLVLAYDNVDWQKVMLWIDAFPEQMNDFVTIEKYVITERNKNIVSVCEEQAFKIRLSEDQQVQKINKKLF